jgi:uncharacterized membrane protein
LSRKPSDAAARWHRVAVASILALALTELLWELLLAPLRSGGSWLALKALPLALLWLALVRGSHKARQFASLLLPIYFGEALVRALSESGRHALVAAVAAALAGVAFAALLISFRRARDRSKPAPP